MKLKRLDIHGFKSFYHRTTLAFDDGITAVVGPNGCGKSNIVDAIKWVMGEQGARNLRGATMEDVIFGGSGKRGPMGLCEVGLVFDNRAPLKINGELVNPSEIGIERRLERGRGSDYLINKRRCRLVDVQELVAGTGVGAGPGGRRAYAIIEQGQISRIVSAKAEERRTLIEEAAGITVYRQRRRLAERKFHETEQNLERVLDVIGEVETQLRALRRQSKKALRFKAYQEESLTIGLRVAAFEYLQLEGALGVAKAAVLNIETLVSDFQVSVDAAETENEALSLVHRKAESDLREASARLRQSEERGRLAAERMAGLTREKEVLLAQLDRARQDASDGEARQHEIEADYQASVNAVELLEREASTDSATLATAISAEKEAAVKLLDERAHLEDLTRRESEELERMARAVAKRDVARSRIESLRTELIALGDEERALERREAEVGEGQGMAKSQVTEADGVLDKLVAERTAQQTALRLIYSQRDTVRDALQSALEACLAQSARIDSLRDLIERSAELSEGNRALLESGSEVVKGPISELFTVPEALEPAVLAALGHRIDGVVVNHLDDATDLLASLQDLGHGRGLCFATDTPQRVQGEAPERAGVVGWLTEALPHQSNPAAYTLLQNWLLVEDITIAMALLRDHWTGNIVTRHGERIEDGRLIEGGAFNDGGPLSHRRALEQLEARFSQLESHRIETLATMETLTAQVAEAKALLDTTEKDIEVAKAHQATLKLDVERLERDLIRVAEDRGRLLKRSQALSTQIANEKSGAQEAESLCQQAEQARTDRASEIREAETRVLKCQRARDEAVSSVHEARAKVAARTERLSSAKMVEHRLKRQLDEIGKRQARSEELGRETSVRLNVIAGHLIEDEEVRRVANAEAIALSQDVQHAQSVMQERESGLDKTRGELKKRRTELERQKENLVSAKLEEEKANLRIIAAWERLRDRFQLTDRSSLSAFQNVEAPDTEERSRLATLDELMHKMGDVNLAAIEECEKVQERHDFMVSQSQDLTDGLTNLQKAIKEIDETSKVLFATAFDAINDHFKALFPRLFRGGEAELELTEPHDLLNTGVHMMARPPGKKIQRVELMSGGEKAMCALALVFAVFRFNPSPFCLLDEVDAPLDDANIGRFNEVVRELAQQSQVVLVTHNKRTMEIADALYGVTMEEAGVSKLVSVRMN